MNTVSATTARTKLYDLIDEVAASGKRVGITKKGETKAVLMSQEDLDSLEATLDVMSDPGLMEAIRKGDEDIKAGRFISLEELEKELGFNDVSSKFIKPRRKRAKKA